MQKFNWPRQINGNILNLKLVGLWPRDNESLKHTIWTFICVVCLNLGPNVFQTANIVTIFDNLNAVISNIFLTLTQVLTTLKAFYIVRNKKVLKELMLYLQCDEFQPKNSKQIELVQPALRAWKMGFYVYWIMSLGAVVMLAAYPILDNSVQEHHLPFTTWYPFNTDRSPVYELTYVYQALGITCSATSAIGVDALFAALNFFVGAQLEILRDDVEQLAGKDFNRKLIECIKHHTKIIEFAEHVNKFFNWIIFMQFFTSTVSIGFTMFQLTVVPFGSSEFYSLISFMFSIVVEIFMYCWYGNEVTLKSEQIPYAAFKSDWTSTSLIAKKNLIFFTRRCQKPLKMSAMNLFYLSLETFVKILRTGYSYFALLNQVSS